LTDTPMMELRDLRYFVACVEHGGVTAAARAVHAAQPTLSHALRRLERDAGAPLFDRHPGGRLRATAAGRLLLARARAALAAVAGFADDLAGLEGLARGELLVATNPSLNATLLPRPVALFAARHPGVAVQVRTYPAESLAAAVRQGREEIGLCAGVPAETLAGLTVRRLYQERFVAIVHRADPLARRRQVPLAALRDRPLALVPSGTFTGVVIHSACERAGFVPRVAVTLDSGEGLREIVRAGHATTILPERYLAPGDPTLRSVRLVDPTPVRDVLALSSPARAVTRAALAFLDLLDAEAGRRRPAPPPS
jgi:DNA-binding transcriptional LysR family regulator